MKYLSCFGLCLNLLFQDILTNSCEQLDFNSSHEQQKKWQAASLKIGEIIFHINPVFDESNTSENKGLAYWTNRLHIQTKTHVIKQQLLFKVGDLFSIEKLQESERIIRANDFFYDANIQPLKVCNKQVTVRVEVRDMWTLLPDIGLKRSGGDNDSRLGFRDSNFLGLGKEVVLVRKTDEERSGFTLTYKDPNLFGSRYKMRLKYEDNNDGELHEFNLQRPFYAQKTLWSNGLILKSSERKDKLYFRNNVIQEFVNQHEFIKAFIARSVESSDHRTHRLLLGYSSSQNDFFSTEATAPSEVFPENRKYAYPWLAWQMVDNAFIEVRNFNHMKRTEDLNLGWDVWFQLGHASDDTGSDDQGYVFEGYLRKNFKITAKQILSFDTTLSGIKSDEGLLDFKTTVSTRFYHNRSENQQFYGLIQFSKSQHLFNDKQLLLGGNTGLRGYPSRYQNGDRSFLITIEQRFYFNYELWQLFDTGGVVFADAGRAWFKNSNNGTNGGVLKDIGIGLRFSPTRAAKNMVLHLDFAIPLDKDKTDLDAFQINFEAKKSF